MEANTKPRTSVSSLQSGTRSSQATVRAAILRLGSYGPEVLLCRHQSSASCMWTLPGGDVPLLNGNVDDALEHYICKVAGQGVWDAKSRIVGFERLATSQPDLFTSDHMQHYFLIAVKSTDEGPRVHQDAYETMWAKSAEVPALQLAAETKKAIQKAFGVAGDAVMRNSLWDL